MYIGIDVLGLDCLWVCEWIFILCNEVNLFILNICIFDIFFVEKR